MQQILKSYLRFNQRLFTRLAVLTLLYAFAMPGFSSDGDHENKEYRSIWHSGKVIEVDVAEDHTRFMFDEAPVFDNGFPKAGNAFVTHGYIYKKGFFDNNEEGVDEQGAPVWPDQVIGEWTCRGYFVGDGANTITGPWVISTQTFDLYSQPGYYKNQEREYGKRMVTTEGYEVVDVDKPVHRAITGGTGRYSTIGGEHIQTSFGLGQFQGVKSRHVIKMRRR